MIKQNIADHCFAPLIARNARLLVLGSYPGISSLEKQEYYAHPRNVFWRIMSEIIGFDRSSNYQKRTGALSDAGVALWDVLYSCKRVGSLDSKIESRSIYVNDFETLLRSNTELKAIIFNGAKAEQEFRKRVVPTVAGLTESTELIRLPSTSPALAALSFIEKLERWRVIENYLC